MTRASWVHADRMHLTLLFIGNADEPLERRIVSAFAEPVQQAPFDIAFDGLGFFPPHDPPRVLWLGIRDGADQLRAVQRAVVKRLELAEERFTPHLTLARFRDRVARTKLKDIVTVAASAGPSRIDRVTLYQSRLSPAGSTYVPLAEAPLTS